MGFAGFLATTVGILLCVLAANGRLQPTIAAMFGQAQPGATPTGGSSSTTSSSGGGGFGGWLQGLLGGLGSGGSGGGGGDGSGGDGSGGNSGSGGMGGGGAGANLAHALRHARGERDTIVTRET